MTKYIIVTGGVISGVGKGVTTASIGKILKEYGYKVTAIKIDPYLNYDAGTLRPTEHGEVWVTDDGGEIDQDLGNYERFFDISIPTESFPEPMNPIRIIFSGISNPFYVRIVTCFYIFHCIGAKFS